MPQVFLGRTKFAFVFRNEKTDSNCWLKVYCKEMVGAYCLNYRLQMYSRNITDTAGPIWHWQEICNPNLIYPRQIEFQQELIIELTYQKVSLQEDSLACGIYYNCTRTKIHHPYYGNPNTSTSTSTTTTTSSTTTTKQQKTTSFLTSTVRGPTSQGRKLTDFFFPCISFCSKESSFVWACHNVCKSYCNLFVQITNEFLHHSMSRAFFVKNDKLCLALFSTERRKAEKTYLL